MNSLYKSGNDWILNGGVSPSGQFRLSIVGSQVALLGGQTGERVDDYVEVTTISKNVGGDKYATYDEFYAATKLFFTKSQSTLDFLKLPQQYEGYSTIDKYGVNLAIASGPEDIWEFGGEYNYDADDTAPILYLSSSDNDDTEPITVQGLDIDGNEVIQTIVLTGQTNVLLTTPLWRVYRMENDGTVDLEGTVYCHTDAAPASGVPAIAKTRAIIDDGNNQTLMMLYTVPKGKVGFIYKGEVGIQFDSGPAAINEFAHLHYESRRLGKVFKTKKAVTIMTGQGVYQDVRTFPDIVPALTDIKFCCKYVSAAMGIWGTLDMLLVDEDKFSESFLQAIGQP